MVCRKRFFPIVESAMVQFTANALFRRFRAGPIAASGRWTSAPTAGSSSRPDLVVLAAASDATGSGDPAKPVLRDSTNPEDVPVQQFPSAVSAARKG
jgi:hypothetical protein